MRTTSMMVEALVEMREQSGGVPQEHFWQLAERFRADLVNHAFAIVGKQSDAEDIAQDTLCRAFLDLAKLDDPNKLGSWMRSINRMNALQLLRRQKRMREQRLATGEVATLTKTKFPNRRATPDGSATLAKEDRVIQAVDSLQEPFREVVVLYYWEKLTLAQIAERLGIPPGTVRSRAARADEQLFRKLQSYKRSEEHPK